MFPDKGTNLGETKVAFVFFGFEDVRLNFATGFAMYGNLKIVFKTPDGVLPAISEKVIGYQISHPWDTTQGHPGSAMGWAKNAPTIGGASYGDGYHIYDDRKTWLQDKAINTMSNGQVCSDNGVYCKAMAMEVTLPLLDPGTYDVHLELAVGTNVKKFKLMKTFTVYGGEALVTAVEPRVVTRDGLTSITVAGLGFHTAGEPDPGEWMNGLAGPFKPLLNMNLQLSIGPSPFSAEHDVRHVFTKQPKSDGTPQYQIYTGLAPTNPFWKARVSYYPAFTVAPGPNSTTLLTVSMNGITWPVCTANNTVQIAVSGNRQNQILSTMSAYFPSASFHGYEPQSRSYLLKPTINDWRPSYHDGVLVPRSRSIQVCVTGKGIMDTGRIHVMMLSPGNAQGTMKEGTVVGEANGTYVSPTKFCFNTPGPNYKFAKQHYPRQVCQTQATSSCVCENWKKKRPHWGLDNACCMQPQNLPWTGPWCFCMKNIRYTNDDGTLTAKWNSAHPKPEKEKQELKQVCDLRYAPQATYNTQVMLVLDKQAADYVSHPMYLYHYEDPEVLAVTPTNASFAEYTKLTVFTKGMIDSSTLKARVFIGGSAVGIPITVTYNSPIMLTVMVPPTAVLSSSVSADFEFSLNGQEWHRTGKYTYGIPYYNSIYPNNLEAGGGAVITIAGAQFLNTSDIGVRLRTMKFLNLEVQRLTTEKARQTALLASVQTLESSLRSTSYDNVWDATERRRLELHAYEHQKFLPLRIAEVQAKIDKALVCLQNPSYTVKATLVNKRKITFVAPVTCVPDVTLTADVDVTHNMAANEPGFQKDMLRVTLYERTRTPSADPPQVMLGRQKVRTERGSAEVGSFEEVAKLNTAHNSPTESPAMSGTHDQKMNRQYREAGEFAHTQVCKYMFTSTLHNYPRTRDAHDNKPLQTVFVKDRYNAKGSVDSEPHMQVPPQMHHQLRRENYKTAQRGPGASEYSIYKGGQDSLYKQDYVTRRFGELPMPRELEKQCLASSQCQVFQDSWRKDWTMPSMTYEVVHCYKIKREPAISSGKRDGFLAKFNSTGHKIWEVRMGGAENDDLNAVTTDRWGNLFTAGQYYSNNITFDSKVLKQMVDTRRMVKLKDSDLTQTSTSIRKLLLTKHNTAGEFIMTTEIAACFKDSCSVESIDADDLGNTFVTGTFTGGITFGSMCSTTTCKTAEQSVGKHKVVMNTLRMAEQCIPDFTSSCPKVPMVRMNSIRRCTTTDTKGKVCRGDVFVAMFNAGGTLMWAENLNTRNVFMQRSALKEVDQSVLNAWTNRAYWGHFHKQTLRHGTKWPVVTTQFWPGGGLYAQSDSDRYWWGTRHGSQPITPGLAASKEWGATCDSNGKCQDRVPPESNKGGEEWPGTPAFGDSAQRN